jgi:methylenetetrahydrofolate reductase (NADPH)
MPITRGNQLGTSVSLSGSSVPKALSDMIEKYGDYPDDMKKAGIDYAVRQVEDLIKNNVDGVHIYSMNKADVTMEIYEETFGDV